MDTNRKYLNQLSLAYPTIKKASAEIINLSANLNLPKGTEHFISDIHGEYESFQHVLKNGSGSIAKKVEDEFGDSLPKEQKRLLCTLIYYPEEKLEMVEREEENFSAWCKWALLQLIRVTRRISSKYTRSKLKQALPPEFEYIVEELIMERPEVSNKSAYYDEILEAILETESAKQYIITFCRLIQHLAIDRLHVIGDIFDRGANADKVVETLYQYHSVDIQWGNHDIAWMGAACGSRSCISSVIRISLRYGNFNTLENGYGINLVPLITFALNTYGQDDCKLFQIPWGTKDEQYIFSKVHKAITIILLKLEGQMAAHRPEFGMNNRRLLEHIDAERGLFVIDGKEYPLLDCNFPTLQPHDPYALTEEETEVMERLRESFLGSEKLQRHIEFLYNRGSMYRIYNGNLLYHGCVPLSPDGEFESVNLHGEEVKGKALFDALEKWARKARYSRVQEDREYGRDVMFFMWSCPSSPLFGKEKMATFERYFLSDEHMKEEHKNSYYRFYNDKNKVKKIFEEFGLDMEQGIIINGHVPVKVKEGQRPVHCDGKVIVIDGGFSKAYQGVTGIAGYTLVSNSHGIKLVAHTPFVSIKEAIVGEKDIHSETEILNSSGNRLRVLDTDKGKEMQERIADLKQLILCYKRGIIREHQG